MPRPALGTVDKRHRHFTDALVHRFPGPSGPSGEVLYRDTRQPSLGLRVTATGVRSYFAEVWFHLEGARGRSRRETIGRVGDFTVDQARERAAKIRGSYKGGTDRRAEQRRADTAAITLRAAMDDFLAFKREKGKHTTRTQSDVREAIAAAFANWMDRPLASITADMVLARHAERTRDTKRAQARRKQRASGARANVEMRYLRAIWNFARKANRVDRAYVLPESPTAHISELDAWNDVRPKTRTVEPESLPRWYAALAALPATPARDWIEFIWLTGLRSTESRTLRWSDVDMERLAFIQADTKNGQPLEIPITPPVAAILARRAAARVNKYVFPSAGARKASGPEHLSDSAATVRALAEHYGRPWSPHDCRAAFVTAGASCRIHPFMVRVLSNHKLPRSDAHAHYFRPSLAEKAEAAETVQRYLMLKAGIAEPGRVLKMTRKAAG